ASLYKLSGGILHHILDLTSAQAHDNTYATMVLCEAKLAEARANLVLARHNLDQCRIVAPISGRIGQKMFSEGNYVTPEVGVLATIVQYSPIDVRFPMSESEYFRYFHSHDEIGNVNIDIIRANGERYDGSVAVDYVDNQVDRATDTIMVTMECDNPRDQLLPGGYVQVHVAERYDDAVPAVGTAALMTDGQAHYVYVVGPDDTVERRSVVAGDLVQRRQAITSGLVPGERVITGGMNKIRPGDKVRPVLVQNESSPSTARANSLKNN
ncbi:MAG: efflux RND transporter periplasmic adaptor subunit, partial [Planctomycetaceae bacterium]|nr:efflux RND transporter periplasmic adaptor subunit [Planctomycetaceae bacterium]